MINVFSVLDMKASFRRFVSKYYMIGSFLVVILAFIGIMNFFNTTATSVISRKKELALLEVVGMTKKQVSKMLVTEGFLYLGGAFVIAVLLIVFGAKQILVNTLGYSIFLPAASYDSAMCVYDSNFGWDCVCDTKVSV